MAEIRNYTMNFGSGRVLCTLDLLRKSASTEVLALPPLVLGGSRLD